jgi:hypothetical protein
MPQRCKRVDAATELRLTSGATKTGHPRSANSVRSVRKNHRVPCNSVRRMNTGHKDALRIMLGSRPELQLWWTYPVWLPGMDKGHKDTTGDDNAGRLLGGNNRGGYKLPTFPN